MAAKCRSARYYARNPRARKKKARYDTKLNRRKCQVRKRVQCNRKRAQARKRGKSIRGKDYDHRTRRFVKSSTNRGRRGEGGRKRKRKR